MVLIHMKKEFDIKMVDNNCFLGIEYEKMKNGNYILHQSSLIHKIVKKFNMTEAREVHTPTDSNQDLSNYHVSEKVNFPFRELVGSLLFLSTTTRPDISYSVAVISRYLENPSKIHIEAAKRIVKYLKGTQNYGLIYERKKREEKHELMAYSDADYAGDVNSRKSTSGYVLLVDNCLVIWGTERQRSVSLSTTESEYIAVCTTVKEMVWMRFFLSEIFGKDEEFKKFTLHVDNQSAIRLIRNPEFHKRSKHIDVRFQFIREKFKEGFFDLEYVETSKQRADMFMKSLTKDKFERNRKMIKIGNLN